LLDRPLALNIPEYVLLSCLQHQNTGNFATNTTYVDSNVEHFHMQNTQFYIKLC